MVTGQTIAIGLGAFAALIIPSLQLSAREEWPSHLQFDLVFPKNETYAPTQYFPIIFGVQGLKEWSKDMPFSFAITIKPGTLEKEKFGQHANETYADMNYEMVGERLDELAPGQFFFHIPTVNLTNGTTGDFIIDWAVRIKNYCELDNVKNSTGFLPEGSDLGNGWKYYYEYYYKSHKSVFRTTTDAPLPDIAATVKSCEESEDDAVSHSPVDILGFRNSMNGGRCPQFVTNATLNKCGYKSVANELAANVSSIILGQMRCEEDAGDWRKIEWRCPSTATSLGTSLSLGWLMFLVATAAFYF
jgi:hypothetical protein